MALQPSPSLQVPHLIHIGFPKCASTFLQQWFAEHPQLIYKPGAFGGIYDVPDLIASVLNADQRGMVRVTSSEMLSDPRDPATFHEVETADAATRRKRMKQVCAALARMFPDAKILMITRNQPDLLISGYSQIVRQGGHVIESDMVRAGPDAYKHVTPFDFDLALSTYRQHFGGRVLALPYEMLVDDRQGFLAAIAGFIGVSRFDTAAGRVNEALTDEQLYWYPRMMRAVMRIPSARVVNRFRLFHCKMIDRGGWAPLLRALRVLGRKKSISRKLPALVLARLAINCEELLKSDFYAPYRDLYRLDGASAFAGSSGPPVCS